MIRCQIKKINNNIHDTTNTAGLQEQSVRPCARSSQVRTQCAAAMLPERWRAHEGCVSGAHRREPLRCLIKFLAISVFTVKLLEFLYRIILTHTDISCYLHTITDADRDKDRHNLMYSLSRWTGVFEARRRGNGGDDKSEVVECIGDESRKGWGAGAKRMEDENMENSHLFCYCGSSFFFQDKSIPRNNVWKQILQIVSQMFPKSFPNVCK